MDVSKTVEDFEKTEKALHIDTLDLAEKMTGKSYKDDEETGGLGFGIQMMLNAQKKQMMQEQGDIHFGSGIADYLKVMKEIGFEIVYTEPFTTRHNPNEKQIIETYYIMWHPKKYILASIETYNIIDLNSSKWYFAYKPVSTEDYYKQSFHHSGCWYGAREDLPRSEWVWVGNWDAREGIKHEIIKCDMSGKFVEWPVPQYLQLNTYGDWDKCKDHNYKVADDMTKKRFDSLPSHVKAVIKGFRDIPVPIKDSYKNN